MTNVLDGRAIAAAMRERLAKEVADLVAVGRTVRLAVVGIGDDPVAASYLRGIERAAKATGVDFGHHRLPAGADVYEVAALIADLAADPTIAGIALQSPLPSGMEAARLGAAIPPGKDVDGISPTSAGRLLLGLPAHAPATAAAVLELARLGPSPVAGAHAVVVGRSPVVGKPAAVLLLAEQATVTVCHSRTPDLAAVTRRADILVAAVGRPKLITADHVKAGATVIDVGINEVDGELVGDVAFDAVAPKAGAVTPVPGGVGPLTTTMLMANTVAAAAGRIS